MKATGSRCAVYVRVSDQKQEANYSLATQEAQCREKANREGWDVLQVYREVHTAVEFWERPELTRLRENLRCGEYDVLLAFDPDRTLRNQTYVGLVLDECIRNDCRLAFATCDFEDTATGKFLLNARVFAAEMEWEKIRERTLRGRKARVESGKLLAGQRPRYGYQWDDPQTKACFVEDPLTARVVRRIFREVIEGRPLKAIARGLTEDGIPTPRHKPEAERLSMWHPQRIKEAIQWPGYKGEAYAFVKRSAATKQDGLKNKRQLVRPREEWISLPEGTIPSLVDTETWQAANDRLAWNKTNGVKEKSRADEALLRGGFVRCGHCGDVMRVFWQHVGKGGYGMAYQCQRNYRRHREDPDRCSWHTISADELDAAVWERVTEILLKPEVVEREVERLLGEERTFADLDAIDRRLATISREQARLADSVARLDDEDAAAPLLEKLRTLGDEKRRLTGDKTSLEALRASQEARRAEQRRVIDWVARVRERLERPDGLTPEQKRLALTALGTAVRVWRRDHGGDRYEIVFNLLPGTLPDGDPEGGAGVGASAERYASTGEAGPAGGERWREAGCCPEPAGGHACLARPA